MSRSRIHRRQLLKGMAACMAGGTVGLSALGRPGRLGRIHAQTPRSDKKPCFLIVMPAFGGASIIDSFLAIRASESANPLAINVFPDDEVQDIVGSPLRAVDLRRDAIGPIPFPFATRQSTFVNKHKQDMMVVTLTGTSVNHVVAQKRSITGNNAWSGRTLQEMVALEHGEGYLVPNVNMSTMGYLEHGEDPTLPSRCYNEPVTHPALWPLSLDGSRGIEGAPDRDLVARARAVRDQGLDPESPFARTFARSEALQRWQQQRGMQADIEARELITRLNIFPDTPAMPLSAYGLDTSPDAERLRAVFPGFQSDPLQAQAALAFLLLKYRVSVTVTISPTFNLVLPTAGDIMPNLPLAFDFSHNAHRAAQAIMWQRVLDVLDRLIDLLRSEELDPATGESFWDRTLVYVPTDFGRSRERPGGADDFSSSHHLNNGYLIISPLANGNTVLGGVDPDTGLTYGFDPRTGAPDPGRHMTEAEIYAGLLQAVEVSTTGSGLPDMRAMRRRG
jgi:hypothetical protein